MRSLFHKKENKWRLVQTEFQYKFSLTRNPLGQWSIFPTPSLSVCLSLSLSLSRTAPSDNPCDALSTKLPRPSKLIKLFVLILQTKTTPGKLEKYSFHTVTHPDTKRISIRMVIVARNNISIHACLNHTIITGEYPSIWIYSVQYRDTIGRVRVT